MSAIRISLLGHPQLSIDGDAVVLSSSKQRALLAMLALTGERGLPTDAIIRRLWGDDPPATARKNVHVLVNRLRRTIRDDEAIRSTDVGYRLDRDRVDVDVEQFDRLHARAVDLVRRAWWHESTDVTAAAIGLWRGDALGDIADAEWARVEAGRLDEARVVVAELHATAELRLGRHDRVIAVLDELVARHPHRRSLHELRIEAYAGAGLQSHALDACRDALEALPRDQAVHVHELQRRVLRQDPTFMPPRRHVGPALPAPPRPAHGIVGRERDLARLRELLRSDERLVTISGAGGCGKTRLAVELARTMHDHVDGVAWIDLAQVRDADAIAPMLVRAFGITGGDGDPLDAVAGAIGDRRLLVVFDNFEHVLGGATIVAALHEATSRAVFLATSRTPLSLGAEFVHQLEPLSVDAVASTPPAVELFLERARHVDGLVDESPGTLSAITDLCRLLDGLPLGIELAAARTVLLTPAQVHRRLEESMRLLQSRDPARPARQRSLDDVVAWSYQLLEEGEKAVLQAISIFVDGGAVHHLTEVMRGMDQASIVTALDSLAARNMLVDGTDELGSRRVRLLETIARFARTQLAVRSDEQELRSRFAGVMHDVARASNSHSRDAAAARERLRIEIANVHAAIEWGIDRDPELAASSYVMLDRHVRVYSSFPEAERVGRRVIAVEPRISSSLRPAVCLSLGTVLHYRGDSSASRELLERALEDFDCAGDHRRAALARVALVDSLRNAGEFERALRLAEQSLVTARELGDRWLEARSLAAIGWVYGDSDQGDDSLRLASQSTRLFAEVGDEFWYLMGEASRISQLCMADDSPELLDEMDACAARASELGWWGVATYARGLQIRMLIEHERYEAANQLAELELPAIRAAGEQLLFGFTVSCVSASYALDGRPGPAGKRAVEAIDVALRADALMFADYPTFALAACHLACDRLEACLECLAAIDPARLPDEYVLDTVIRNRREQMLDGLRAELGAEAVDHVIDGQSGQERREQLERVFQRATTSPPVVKG